MEIALRPGMHSCGEAHVAIDGAVLIHVMLYGDLAPVLAFHGSSTNTDLCKGPAEWDVLTLRVPLSHGQPVTVIGFVQTSGERVTLTDATEHPEPGDLGDPWAVHAFTVIPP